MKAVQFCPALFIERASMSQDDAPLASPVNVRVDASWREQEQQLQDTSQTEDQSGWSVVDFQRGRFGRVAHPSAFQSSSRVPRPSFAWAGFSSVARGIQPGAPFLAFFANEWATRTSFVC